MKNLILFLSIGLICLLSSCEKEEIRKPSDSDTPIVSQFVYDGMSTFYYWNRQMTAKKPTANDADPKKYFSSTLSDIDTRNGWSWITDDVDALLSQFSGQALSFGYDLAFIKIDNEVYALIRYVYANTPAEKAGFRRLDLIGRLNGQPITTETRDDIDYISNKDVNLLYGHNPVAFTIYRFSDNGIVQENREVIITPDDSSKDPVVFDTIYTIGNEKIGYLFYTDFYDNYNHRLHEVFSRFKQNGITDLVLDLRYNTGGSVSAATYLASLIAPKDIVENKSPYIVMDYNDLLNRIFDKAYNEAAPANKYKHDRKEYLGVYDSSKDKNPLEANLDLKRVYIIATGNSYSASELTLFCLGSHMEVHHIGSNTGGKYTASWTIHAYDPLKDKYGRSRANTLYDESGLSPTQKNELKKWAMQPIVAIYSNKDSKNFSQPGYLSPKELLDEGFGSYKQWAPLGDTKDVLLGQALYVITGDESYQPVPPRQARSIQTISEEIVNPENAAKPLIIYNKNLTAEDFKKLQELR